MSLLDYRRKRQFGKTREPAPGAAVEPHRAIFVVQLHHASRRHYDFRLQVGDALKSWAVPKGPSYDPTVKRMAIEVEDHPLSYADFAGEIARDQYGGGHVALFDRGVWSTPYEVEAQLAKGHLQFELFGDKLKGSWHLVRSQRRSKQPEWLLIKHKDRYASTLEADDLLAGVEPPPPADARRAGTGKAHKKQLAAPPAAAKRKPRRIDWAARARKLPKARAAKLRDQAFAPQLARLAERPPEGPGWLHELKWDGYRLVTTIVAGKVRIWSRNGLEWTDKVPEIRDALVELGLDSAALDGELIAGAGTQADFGLLQATLSGERHGTLAYALFDLLHLQGIDISTAPLLARKQLLARLLESPPAHLAYSSHVEGDGKAAFALATERGFEGIISKRADAPYRHGRGDDWRKIKRMDSDEFAVVGYTPGKGARADFGSLLLARPDPEHGWSYAGRVGTGFSDQLIRDLRKRIGKAGASEPSVHLPAQVDTDLRTAKWFAPMFVVEVFIRGIGTSGVLRQPSLKAVRPDKEVADLQGGGMASKLATKKAAARKSPAKEPAKQRAKAGTAPVIQISSPSKLLYPADRISKQQVADYYEAVMPWLLPEIAGRPLSVIRCPAGTGKQCFFQKHHTAGMQHVDLVRLKEESGVRADYLVANDATAVMELVQFNTLEFHPWGARADSPDRADRVVFDLDPGPGVPWAEVKRAALLVRDLLKRLQLKSYLRSTGGKGLHVVVPLNPGNDWALVKRFAKGFAESMAASEPARFVATSSLKARPKKIYVDYLRNGRGATAVASYSLRARDGAPVALPLPWTALAGLKRGDAYTLKDVPALLRKRRDPWAGIGEVRQDLSRFDA